MSMVRECEQKALTMKEAISTHIESRYQQLYSKMQQLDSIYKTATNSSHSELMKARVLAEKLFADIFVL